MAQIIKTIKLEKENFYKKDVMAFTFQKNDKIDPVKDKVVFRSIGVTNALKFGQSVIPECPPSDPLGLLHDTEIEPIEHQIINLPNLNPVRRIIQMENQQEDGLYAHLCCEPGQDRKRFNLEMAQFFSN